MAPSMCAVLGILIFHGCAAAALADDRLWIEARINGQQAHLIFDTGADRVLLFPRGAERLGLRVSHAPLVRQVPDGKVAVGRTEACDLTLGRTTVRAPLAVLRLPAYLHIRADGVIGWGPLKNNILRINADALTGAFLAEVPAESKTTWLSLAIRADSDFLILKTAGTNCSNGIVLVDTGYSGGVALAPQKWRDWKAAHVHQPTTLDSYFMPGAGLVVKEEMWAAELVLGSLRLTDVPVMEANSAQTALGGAGYQASIGLAALKRLDLVIDGRRAIAYLCLREPPAPAYPQNRLGAVFVPTVPSQDALLARVIPRSPAFEAGIRDGDALLKVDNLDVTNWRTSPGILPLARFWEQPAGTRLRLTLERQGNLYCTTVLLREILSSGHKKT